MISYRVTRIEEMDHGCEGIQEGEEVKVYVYLVSSDGDEKVVCHSDSLLYERGIEEGDAVILEEDETLYKMN